MSPAPPGSARSPTFGINFVRAQEPGLEFRVLMDDTFVLAVNSDDPVASLHEIRWEDVEKERFIAVWKGSGTVC